VLTTVAIDGELFDMHAMPAVVEALREALPRHQHAWTVVGA